MGELPTSPATSSVDPSDDEPFDSQPDRRTTSRQSHNDQPGTGTHLAPDRSESPKAPTTIQKRRRVTRACDECRRKKIKCDGKQPCTHCTVYSYDCTYDQPSNRRRNPAPQYVEALENRLEKAQSLLKTVLPDVNLDDPKYDAMMPQRMHVPIKQEEESSTNGIKESLAIHSINGLTATEAQKDSLLESMVLEAGSLHLDDQGHWDFFGQSSGMVFLRRMREQFGDLLAKFEDTGIPFTKSSTISGRLMSPRPASGSPMDPSKNNAHDFPAKSCARKLCSYALNDAATLFPFVHKPTFYHMFDRIYDTPRASYEPVDEKFLPLFYSVIALGCLFSTAEESMLQSYGYESATDLGFTWFQVARQLMDVTDCRDLSSLQALLIMIMFLQASSKLSTCYSHIGIALRSALRMGLHRSVPNQFSPIEQETRKRIFWVIRNQDIYVGQSQCFVICST
ncbi:Gypsy retrotransposon integrase-like protein 1 [Xanthoria calcicola]